MPNRCPASPHAYLMEASGSTTGLQMHKGIKEVGCLNTFVDMHPHPLCWGLRLKTCLSPDEVSCT